MIPRFTDNMLKNSHGSDFIVRKRRPLAIQLFFIFAIAFVVIYIAANAMKGISGQFLFTLILGVTIGALAGFTIFFAARLRDTLLATEFQNAMLATAAQLATRFCMITRRDGSVVYVDPGFQAFFPQFMQSNNGTIDELFSTLDVSPGTLKTIYDVLEDSRSDRIQLSLKDGGKAPSPMVITIDPLPKPRGYFLFRGRDFVEKRTVPEDKNARPIDTASAALLAQAIYTLPEGILIVNADNVITYVNHTVEEWLGYPAGELLARPTRVDKVFYQYKGSEVGYMMEGNFDGELTMQRKNRTLVSVSLRQTNLYENGKRLGFSAVLSTAAGDR